MKRIIAAILLVGSLSVVAQESPITLYDTVFHFGDLTGKQYALKELEVNQNEGLGVSNRPAPTFTCNAGYFRLYFEAGVAWTNAEMNTLCQLYTDLSCFINSPLNGGCGAATSNNTKVNIFVSDDEIVAGGSAMPIFIFPGAPSFAPSVAENAIWKTITSGTDAFAGVATPVISFNNFYHGFINVNRTTITNWNYNTAINCPPGMPDFYSVNLHEAMHALGFASLFSPSGLSQYGAANNYYGKYDTYLRNSNNVPLLNSTIAGCPNSGLQYTQGPATANINPGNCAIACCPSPINCATAVRYVGSYNVPVYTPNCFVTGSSISHFESGCYSGGTSPNTPLTYFSMVWGSSSGTTRRNITQEERGVLCDLGYSVKNVYNSLHSQPLELIVEMCVILIPSGGIMTVY